MDDVTILNRWLCCTSVDWEFVLDANMDDLSMLTGVAAALSHVQRAGC